MVVFLFHLFFYMMLKERLVAILKLQLQGVLFFKKLNEPLLLIIFSEKIKQIKPIFGRKNLETWKPGSMSNVLGVKV